MRICLEGEVHSLFERHLGLLIQDIYLPPAGEYSYTLGATLVGCFSQKDGNWQQKVAYPMIPEWHRLFSPFVGGEYRSAD